MNLGYFLIFFGIIVLLLLEFILGKFFKGLRFCLIVGCFRLICLGSGSFLLSCFIGGWSWKVGFGECVSLLVKEVLWGLFFIFFVSYGCFLLVNLVFGFLWI